MGLSMYKMVDCGSGCGNTTTIIFYWKIESSIRVVVRRISFDKVDTSNSLIIMVSCLMCNATYYVSETLTPARCTDNHRICVACWFDPVHGFGLETSDHRCIGCGDPVRPTVRPTDNTEPGSSAANPIHLE
jgi:hypothetical protein